MHKGAVVWFIVGLTSCLQILASLSILELLILLTAPICVFSEYDFMRRTGAHRAFWLSIILVVGCGVACVVNRSPVEFSLRGLAVCSLISCSLVVAHRLLRTDMPSVRWMFVGIAIGMVVNIFIFRNAYSLNEEVTSGINKTGHGGLFWLSHFSGLIDMLPKGWYLQFPSPLTLAIPLLFALYGILFSVSGRSAALGYLGCFALALLGGKRIATMKRISKRFWWLVAAGLVGLVCVKLVYQEAASRGWLGDEARLKYERQTHGDESVKALLLGGRIDSFVGLVACIDKPIVGWGPWALDTEGYYGEFLSKYGAQEDFDAYNANLSRALRYGHVINARLIPVHSVLTEFWCWYGIAGLIFVIYALFVLIRFIKDDIAAIPQWYYWLACGMVARMWDIFFSPFADRFGFSLVIVACLMARSVRQKKIRLPHNMLKEVREVENKERCLANHIDSDCKL